MSATAVFSIKDGDWRLLTTGGAENVLSLANAWTKFKGEFGVHRLDDPSPQGVMAATTASEDTLSARFELFTKAYNFITAHNERFFAGKSKYKLAVNHFADLSIDELRFYTGGDNLGRPQDEGYEGNVEPSEIPMVSDEVLKGGVDWRTSTLPIHNQGQCGSCWAFASTAMVENRIYQASGEYTELANQELVDCVSGCYGCMGGWSFKATSYIESYGLANEDTYPYYATDGSCMQNSYERHIPAGDVTAQYMKAQGESQMAQIVANGAMTIAIDVLYDFYFITDDIYQPDYGSCSSNNNLYVGAHAIALVGYGSSDSDYWIIQNSWGTGWGNSGFAYLVKGENVCNVGYWDNWSWVTVNTNVEDDEEDFEEETEDLSDGTGSKSTAGFLNTPTLITAAIVGSVATLFAVYFFVRWCKSAGYNKMNDEKNLATEIETPAPAVVPVDVKGYQV